MTSQSDMSPRSKKVEHREPERLWRKGFVKQMSLRSGVKIKRE